MRTFIPASLAIFLALAASACGSASIEPTPIVVRVKNYSIPSAFDLQFPTEWQAVMVAEGIMVFGPSEVAAFREPGPSVTVHRIRTDRVAGSDEEVFDNFLTRGPLRGDFETLGEVEVAQLGQYEGFSVDMEREADEELIGMKGKVWMARTDGGAVYFLTATSPSETWESDWPKFKAVHESVHFNE